jgi:hypothetical protein
MDYRTKEASLHSLSRVWDFEVFHSDGTIAVSRGCANTNAKKEATATRIIPTVAISTTAKLQDIDGTSDNLAAAEYRTRMDGLAASVPTQRRNLYVQPGRPDGTGLWLAVYPIQ